MIDLHCHILPDIDDGPATHEEALGLARLAVANGIRTIVATPHVSWQYPANGGTLIAAKVAELAADLARAGIPLEVLPGAEIALSRAVELDDEELDALRLGGGPYLLVECPASPSAVGFEEGVWTLRSRGHRIVLAHPERCPGFLRDRSALERLVGDGLLTQLTAGSFAGQFGREIRRFSERMVTDGLAHVVASDAHDTGRRPPSIAAELAAAGLRAQAEHLAGAVPQAILAGTPPPTTTAAENPRRRRRRRRLFS